MSRTTSWSSQPTGEAINRSFQPWSWNNNTFATRKIYKEDSEGVTIINGAASVEAQTSYTFKASPIQNVYSGHNIIPAYYAVNKTGTKILAQIRNYLIVADDTDASKNYILPLKANVTFEIPNDPLITTEVIDQFVNQTIAALASSSGNIAGRIDAQRRGVLTPS